MPTLEMSPALVFMHWEPAWTLFQPPGWLWAQQQDFAPCFPVPQPRLLCRGKRGGPTHVQERKCWEPGPKSLWASWSCFSRSFMEAWGIEKEFTGILDG